MRAARRLRRLNELSDEVEQSAHPVAAASVFLEPEDVCRVACTCQSWSRVLAGEARCRNSRVSIVYVFVYVFVYMFGCVLSV